MRRSVLDECIDEYKPVLIFIGRQALVYIVIWWLKGSRVARTLSCCAWAPLKRKDQLESHSREIIIYDRYGRCVVILGRARGWFC